MGVAHLPLACFASLIQASLSTPFSEWGAVFPDPRLVAAIVDRVTFNAHILETGNKSYRLATSRPAKPQQARAKIHDDQRGQIT
jgi:hypothetical protein